MNTAQKPTAQAHRTMQAAIYLGFLTADQVQEIWALADTDKAAFSAAMSELGLMVDAQHKHNNNHFPLAK